MKWFFPSWNGDVRAETVEGTMVSRLVIVKPTLGEQRMLADLGLRLIKKGWVPEGRALWNPEGDETQQVEIPASLEKLGPLLVRAMKPGKQTLTAIKLENGQVSTVAGSEANLDETVSAALEKKPEAAATVKRATPCCPQCMPGAVEPATEVLLTFLTPEQHRQWAAERMIVVYGGRTGHRYLLAHRHTERARRMGRICKDLDDDIVVHFHDHSVPPEEEVLGAKLVLEHQEAWLRNEATMIEGYLGEWRASLRVQYFENPLGPGILDGTGDARITNVIGGAVLGYSGQLNEILPALAGAS